MTEKRPKTGGRRKGTPNKVTREVKDAILQAFDKVGGEDYLVRVAEEDPRTVPTLLGKVVPRDVTTKNSHESIIVHVDKVEEPGG